MVFNEPEHPFRESFQEEEVIRDRYATRGEAIAAAPSEAASKPVEVCPAAEAAAAPQGPQDFGLPSEVAEDEPAAETPPSRRSELPSLPWGLDEARPATQTSADGVEALFSWESTETTVVPPVESVIQSGGPPRSRRFDRLFANLRRQERARQ